MGSDTPVDMSLPVYKSTSTDGVQETISRSPLTKVAAGFYAEVYLFDGADIVVKIPKANGQALHDIEKRIYERIESHPNILVFLGEHTAYLPDISGTYQLRKGLSFEYVPGGTLKELLVNTTDPAMMSMVRQRSVTTHICVHISPLTLCKGTTSVGVRTGACSFKGCHTRRCGCP